VDRQTNKQTDRQTDRQIQTDRRDGRTDRQTVITWCFIICQFSGHVECVKWLLANRAKHDVTDVNDRTPGDIAEVCFFIVKKTGCGSLLYETHKDAALPPNFIWTCVWSVLASCSDKCWQICQKSFVIQSHFIIPFAMNSIYIFVVFIHRNTAMKMWLSY
jgi:hypothetical protein